MAEETRNDSAQGTQPKGNETPKVTITAVSTPAGYLRAGEKLMLQIQQNQQADKKE